MKLSRIIQYFLVEIFKVLMDNRLCTDNTLFDRTSNKGGQRKEETREGVRLVKVPRRRLELGLQSEKTGWRYWLLSGDLFVRSKLRDSVVSEMTTRGQPPPLISGDLRPRVTARDKVTTSRAGMRERLTPGSLICDRHRWSSATEGVNRPTVPWPRVATPPRPCTTRPATRFCVWDQIKHKWNTYFQTGPQDSVNKSSKIFKR